VQDNESDAGDGSTHAPDDSGISPAARQSPHLAITRVSRRGRRLIVRGSVARGASGRIVVVFRERGGGRRARRTTYAQSRRFRVALKVAARSRGGTLTATYIGGRNFNSQTRRLNLRSR
jgi:hypothetical protein